MYLASKDYLTGLTQRWTQPPEHTFIDDRAIDMIEGDRVTETTRKIGKIISNMNSKISRNNSKLMEIQEYKVEFSETNLKIETTVSNVENKSPV